MKKQVIIIHGGDIFETYKKYVAYLKQYNFKKDRLKRNRWTDTLEKELGKNYEVFLPIMLNSHNAKYSEWKIWFERLLLICNKEIILIGASLGGLFLVKYLSENKISKKIKGLFLVAAPFGDKEKYYLADFHFNPKNLKKLEQQAKITNLYHSTDDDNVVFSDFEKYKKYLTSVTFHEFKNRNHFGQEKFPEIVKDIKNLK